MRRKILRNPYIAGRVVKEGHGFFGREDVFRFVQATLESPNQNVSILHGQRRIGKTSILHELERRLSNGGYVPVYIDLMHHARTPLNNLLKELALRIQARIEIPDIDLNVIAEQEDWFQAHFLTTVKSSLGNEQQLVLLFDEFDVLDQPTQNQLPSAVADVTFFPYLYKLITVEDDIQFVIVVGRKSEDLSLEARSTLKSATFKRISVLPKEDAVELILQASKFDALYFEDNVPEAIFSLTAGHPFLTQLLCNTLFERAWSSKPDEPPTVSLIDLEVSIPQALERGKNAMEWIWDGLPSAEKVVLAALAGAKERVVSPAQLEAILQDYGIRILLRSLELAPDTLVEWELLRKEEGGYTFFVELVRRWVAANKPAQRVKDELDNVDQLAKSLFETSEFFYRTGELDTATEQLKRVLQINPNHLKARLLLGEVLRDLGQTGAAVRELEQAHRYDAEASQTALLRALIVHGESLEDTGKIEEAVVQYRRALEIIPEDIQAKQHLVAILYQQATEALTALDFDEAMSFYLHILEIDAQNTEAKTKLDQIHNEQWVLETCYTKATILLNQKKWDEAQAVLDKISNINPNYRDIKEKFLFIERSKKSPSPSIAVKEFLLAFYRLPPVAKGGVIAIAVIFLISGMIISWPFMFPPADAVILVAELNLRQAPSLTQYKIIETLPEGTKLSILGKTDGGNWLYVKTHTSSGNIGWITGNTDFVLVNVALANIPLKATPIIPTPVPISLVVNSTPTPSPTPSPSSTMTPISTPTPPSETSLPTPLYTPTSTTTPTNTPTSTSTTLPDVIVISANGLNLRSGPGVNYEIIGFLVNGDILDIQGRVTSNDWIQVVPASLDSSGWVSALPELVQINVDLDKIPLVELPPTPTPSATATSSLPKQYSAPILTGPDNGVGVLGEFPPLHWEWEGNLKDDEFFEVRVWHEDLPYHAALGWVKQPNFDYNVSGERHGKYFWTVLIVQGENERRKNWTLQPWWPYPMWEGDLVQELSAESEPRFFFFTTPSSGSGGGDDDGSPISNPSGGAGCAEPPC